MPISEIIQGANALAISVSSAWAGCWVKRKIASNVFPPEAVGLAHGIFWMICSIMGFNAIAFLVVLGLLPHGIVSALLTIQMMLAMLYALRLHLAPHLIEVLGEHWKVKYAGVMVVSWLTGGIVVYSLGVIF